MQPDGRALIGGYFTHCQDVSRNGIARVNAYTAPVPPTKQTPVGGCVTKGHVNSIPTLGTKRLMKAGCKTDAG